MSPLPSTPRSTSSDPPGANAPIAAAIDGVLEISLLCRADLTFWQAKLAREELRPTEREGQAEILICATNARFKGIPFRELSFSVFVTENEGGATREGAWLVQAFNSNRLFAWIERTLFKTPYHAAKVDVSLKDDALIDARHAGGALSRAACSLGSPAARRNAATSGPDGWSGPIYLPGRNPSQAGMKLFHATLSGDTASYPFDPFQDRFELHSLARFPALEWFQESNLRPREWLVRAAARHVKSKTITRPA